MATTQDTFQQYTSIGFHGQLNTDFPFSISSYHAEDEDIGFGIGVSFGTADRQAVAGASTAASLIGITVRTQAVENNALGQSEYAENRAMSVLQSGRMYVVVPDGSSPGDPVYIVPSTGQVVSSADDGETVPTAYLALAGARFVRTAAAGEISEIEIK